MHHSHREMEYLTSTQSVDVVNVHEKRHRLLLVLVIPTGRRDPWTASERPICLTQRLTSLLPWRETCSGPGTPRWCGPERQVNGWARCLASAPRPGQSVAVALTPELLDKVMTELVLVAASATSKREEAANLARIWGRRVEREEQADRTA